MPRKEQGWITFQTSEEERQILENYCQQCQRTKTEILRELVRKLAMAATPVAESNSKTQKRDSSPPSSVKILTDYSDLKAIKISARNILKGNIKRLVMGPVNTEVLIEIAPNVEIISIITTASAEQLNLRIKKTVYAVIKSSSVMLADS